MILFNLSDPQCVERPASFREFYEEFLHCLKILMQATQANAFHFLSIHAPRYSKQSTVFYWITAFASNFCWDLDCRQFSQFYLRSAGAVHFSSLHASGLGTRLWEENGTENSLVCAESNMAEDQSFEVSTCFHISNRPLPFHLHLHEISKFLDSTNVVKVQVSSILKEEEIS